MKSPPDFVRQASLSSVYLYYLFKVFFGSNFLQINETSICTFSVRRSIFHKVSPLTNCHFLLPDFNIALEKRIYSLLKKILSVYSEKMKVTRIAEGENNNQEDGSKQGRHKKHKKKEA